MVTANAMPAVKYCTAVNKPPNISQIKFPISFIELFSFSVNPKIALLNATSKYL